MRKLAPALATSALVLVVAFVTTAAARDNESGFKTSRVPRCSPP